VDQSNKTQVGGSHYQNKNSLNLQHWDIVALFDLDYFQGQITKYVMRWKDKNGIQDLEKAKHFLEKYIELQKIEKAKTATNPYLIQVGPPSEEKTQVEKEVGKLLGWCPICNGEGGQCSVCGGSGVVSEKSLKQQ
jgi:hypothetical protein